MKFRSRLIAFFSAAGMLILILDSKTALYGAATGIDLCIQTLVPSLFPFFVLSILLTGALSGQILTCLQPICSIIGIPRGSESLIAVSTLGGYPVGAQNVSLLYKQGQLTTSAAVRLLAFCNNAGPSFIFGVVGAMFTDKKAPWFLWLIHIFSAFLVGLLLPKTDSTDQTHFTTPQVRVTDAIIQAVKAMVQVCAWVICMRIILAFIDSWLLRFFPISVQVVVSGLLELSNGCIRLSHIESEGVRFLIASFLLSLGGLSVTLQTASVSEGISMRMYFPGKILQCCISMILSYIFQFLLSFQSHCLRPSLLVLPIVIMMTVLSFFHYSKKVVAFQNPLMYNQLINMKEVSSCCFEKE